MTDKNTIYFVLAVVLLFPLQIKGDEMLLSAGDIEVEDGDTLRVTLGGEIKRVQLVGIDAPEDRENPKFMADKKRTGLDFNTLLSLGIMASDYLRKQLSREESFKLHYQPERVDRYGRMPGELMTQEGLSINKQMVIDGYAIPTKSESTSGLQDYAGLQEQSRQKRAGLWGLLPGPTRLWADLPVAE